MDNKLKMVCGNLIDITSLQSCKPHPQSKARGVWWPCILQTYIDSDQNLMLSHPNLHRELLSNTLWRIRVLSLVPSLFIARGKRVWWNAYSILVPRGKISLRPIRLQNSATSSRKDCDTSPCTLHFTCRRWLHVVVGQLDCYSASDHRSYPAFELC